MKKYLAILLSLALVFCFISCDGSTKTPDGSNGSLTAIPKDSNVPDESSFQPISSSAIKVFSEINEKIGGWDGFTLQGEEHYTKRYKINDGAMLYYYTDVHNEQPISGTYSVKFDSVRNNDIVKESETINGTITIGTDEYTLLDIVRIRKDGDASLTGKAKKKGIETEIDVSTIESSEPGLYAFLKYSSPSYSEETETRYDYSIDTSVHLLTIDNPDFVGQASYEDYLVNDLKLTEVVIDFSKVKLSDRKDHSMTCNLILYPNGSKKINYFSIDGVYFTEDSILKIDF